MKNGKATQDHPELPGFEPRVIIPTIMVPNGDGSFNVRAGKPQIVEEEIGCAEFARHTGYSHSWIMQLCQVGAIKATQRAKGGKYFIPRSELVNFKHNPNE